MFPEYAQLLALKDRIRARGEDVFFLWTARRSPETIKLCQKIIGINSTLSTCIEGMFAYDFSLNPK